MTISELQQILADKKEELGDIEVSISIMEVKSYYEGDGRWMVDRWESQTPIIEVEFIDTSKKLVLKTEGCLLVEEEEAF